jgi:hypothetical protein
MNFKTGLLSTLAVCGFVAADHTEVTLARSFGAGSKVVKQSHNIDGECHSADCRGEYVFNALKLGVNQILTESENGAFYAGAAILFPHDSYEGEAHSLMVEAKAGGIVKGREFDNFSLKTGFAGQFAFSGDHSGFSSALEIGSRYHLSDESSIDFDLSIPTSENGFVALNIGFAKSISSLEKLYSGQ